MIEREINCNISLTIAGVLVAITCVVMIVSAVESARVSSQVLAQLREMRGTMGEAGYLPTEPRYEEKK